MGMLNIFFHQLRLSLAGLTEQVGKKTFEVLTGII